MRGADDEFVFDSQAISSNASLASRLEQNEFHPTLWSWQLAKVSVANQASCCRRPLLLSSFHWLLQTRKRNNCFVFVDLHPIRADSLQCTSMCSLFGQVRSSERSDCSAFYECNCVADINNEDASCSVHLWRKKLRRREPLLAVLSVIFVRVSGQLADALSCAAHAYASAGFIERDQCCVA